MNSIDKNTIQSWLESTFQDKSTPDRLCRIYYIDTCLSLLDKPLNLSNNEIIIEPSLLKSINELSSLKQIHDYLLLCKKYSVSIDIPQIDELKSALASSLNYKANDTQTIYTKILILKLLDEKYLNEKKKKDIEFLIKSDQYQNGSFPDIAKFQLDYKQTYLYVSTLLLLNQYSDIDNDSIKTQLKDITSDTFINLLKSDPYEIYSIIQLNNRLNLNALNDDDIKSIKQNLLNIDTKQINERNLLLFTRKTMILKGIGYNFPNTYLPDNNDTILDSILKNNDEFKDKELLQLIYLDTLINLGYKKTELIKFGDYVNSIEIDMNDDNATALIYCKYLFLTYIDYKFDKQSVYKALEDLQTNVGYGINKKCSFFDPRTTFFCQQLEVLLENGYKDEYMLLLN